MHVIFVSYGNDSVALIQLLHERGVGEGVCLYSDTGWASAEWGERVIMGEALANHYGFQTARTKSIGLPALAKARKGFPRQGMQFCTSELKILPALRWLDETDPGREAVCVVGVRREESTARSGWPEWTEESPRHGGRALWAPLVRVKQEERDALLRRAGFEPLPHRSMECFPCVNANRADLLALAEDPSRIDEISQMEIEVGKTFFRPYRHMGAEGIREVVKWAQSGRGKYKQPIACDSGFCGD